MVFNVANTVSTDFDDEDHGLSALRVCGKTFWADKSGALFWPDEGALIVADLHLEKGSSFAERGAFLPPYDTRSTLGRLRRVVEHFDPNIVVALGDSLHDANAAERICAEDLEIIHELLKSGKVDFAGEYWSARNADLVLRGPRPQGPPIVIAARGPKMMQLTARFADEWNGEVPVEQGPSVETFRPMVAELERACQEVGRDPATLRRSLDIQVDQLGLYDEGEKPIAGSSEEIAEAILAFQEIGVDEVRCYPYWPMPETPGDRQKMIESMAKIVDLVHTG